jgi:hypothetical protein
MLTNIPLTINLDNMADNVALNVVIGLIFIYLLYSLLATVIGEIISTKLGIRALNLKESVNRMLVDSEPQGFGRRFLDSLNILKNPKNGTINKFYNNPEIKYLGSTGIFSTPSTFKATSFARTLLYELNGSGALNTEKIRTELRKLTQPDNSYTPKPGVVQPDARTLHIQSAQFVLSLYNDSDGDLRKFRILLEAWFDRTMEQSTEWYKRKIQVILFIVGFLMAWIFNAGTFTIVEKLTIDKDAREKLANMASAYIQNKNNAGAIPSSDPKQQQSIDTLLSIKRKLEVDIQKANNILGVGSWLPDSVLISYDFKTNAFNFYPHVDQKLIPSKHLVPKSKGTYICFNRTEKILAFLWLFIEHFCGFFITAIAISLGAPFWFDLLNKVMQLRTSQKQPTDSTENIDSVSPLCRIG